MKHEPSICNERIVSAGAINALSSLAERHRLGLRPLIVGDDTTLAVASKPLIEFFSHGATHSLGKQPHAVMRHVEVVMERAGDASSIIAVGSGTINDICKLAAARCALPYIVVATAASMNGYTSATASITTAGHKLSYPAQPPRAVVADLNIITAAPRCLARAGLGDTLCRSTVEADCLLSHHLFGTDYPREGFAALRSHEAGLIVGAWNLRENSPEYIGLLMQALLDGGDWMARTGSSAIASQGEHMIAHTIDMLYDDGHHALHGESIAVATISMQYLQHKMLLGHPTLRPLPPDMEQVHRIFGTSRGEELAQAYRKKLLTAEAAEALNQRLATEWPTIKRELANIMMQGSAIERAFQQANLGCRPKDISLGEYRYQAALAHAHLTRDRFTFLDLAAMMGRRVSPKVLPWPLL